MTDKSPLNFSPEERREWLLTNHIWLNQWLTNVVTQNSMHVEGNRFMTFVSPIESDISKAMSAIKYAVLYQAVFGGISEVKESKQEEMNGYLKQMGHLPTSETQICFLARQWFEISDMPKSKIIGSEKIQVLVTTCSLMIVS